MDLQRKMFLGLSKQLSRMTDREQQFQQCTGYSIQEVIDYALAGYGFVIFSPEDEPKSLSDIFS